ncbi:hypothetical protein [uncultured Sulfitobacter sp.]|uniref:hypothetical protein n=1 Tax=uncultured Sulfitobacter sp. TaxID=191468 RepID=UPI0030D8B001
MPANGVRTTDFSNVSAVDDIIGNYEGTTVRFSIGGLISLIGSRIGPSYETHSVLEDDLDWPDGAIGAVYGDSIEGRIGVYKKSGATEAGSWTRIGDLPVSQATISMLSLKASKAELTAVSDRIDAISTGERRRGSWDPADPFPGGADVIAGDWWEASAAGTRDGLIFAIGDGVQAIADAPSTTVSTGNWDKKRLSAIVKRVYDDHTQLLASLEGARGNGVGYQTLDGAGYVEDTVSPHLVKGAGIGLRYRPVDEVLVSKMVSASDGGDISLAIQRSLNAFEGKRIRVPAGMYPAATTVQLGALERAYIHADGAEIILEEDLPLLRAERATWESVQGIENVDASNYWDGPRVIEVTDGSAYAIEDVVKIFSDNKQRCTRPTPEDGTDYRQGLLAVVAAKSGNFITLDRGTPWDMTINPRIARMPKRRYQWQGGIVGAESGHDATWSSVPFVLYSAHQPRIEVDISRAYGPAIILHGCFEPRVKSHSRRLTDDISTARYGYGVTSNGSQGGRYDVSGGQSRHLWTSNAPQCTANSDAIDDYGQTFNEEVTGHGVGRSQSSANTHHGAENIIFKGLSSAGNFDGHAMIFRGIGIFVDSPRVMGGKDGILAYTEPGVAEPSEIIISNPDIDVQRFPLESTLGSRLLVQGGGRIRSRLYGRMATATAMYNNSDEGSPGTPTTLTHKGQMKLSGVFNMRPGGLSEVDGFRAITAIDAEIDTTDAIVNMDLSDIPAGAATYGIIGLSGLFAAGFKGGVLKTRNDAGLTAAIIKSGAAAITNNPGEIITEKSGNSPYSGMSIVGADFTIPTGRLVWRTLSGNASSKYIEVDIGTNGAAFALRKRGDEHIVARLTPVGGTRTLGVIEKAEHVGQLLTFTCPSTAANNLVIPHGTGFNTILPGGADVTLTPGAQFTLIGCSDGNWRVN